MSERGKARTLALATGSNTTIKDSPGTLYRAFWTKPTGSSIYIKRGPDDLGAAPDLNGPAAGENWIFSGVAATTDYQLDFTPGVEFDKLTVATTSNARVTLIYE